MPSNFQNVLFTGGTITVIEGNQYVEGDRYPGAQAIDEGMKILYAHASPPALHDSGERFDPPKCHPNTRVAVQEEIMNWLNDASGQHCVMWMKGAMGAGKSAIAQAIAQLCYDREQLSSTFFFSRTSNSGRNNETRLVATLAYQMSTSQMIPETRPIISSTLLDNPLIFESSLRSQLESLIIRPLSQLSQISSANKPRLIIIDGLDECLNVPAQALIVRTFVSTLARMQYNLKIPHKILIASRPETNIESAFRDGYVANFTRHLSLDNSWSPDDNIRRYLVDSFAEIIRTHPLGTLLPADWPSTRDIDKLVEKSSGQFIYASFVIKFVQSPRNHPVHCLKVILGLVKDPKHLPYTELDALYLHILSRVNDLDLVLQILCAYLVPDLLYVTTYSDVETFFDIPKGMVKVALGDLASVVQLGEDDVTFLHASFPEFLMDKTRSQQYYINSEEICQDLAYRCLDVLLQKIGIHFLHFSLRGIPYFTSKVNREVRLQIYEAVSSMDIMSNCESIISLALELHEDRDYFYASTGYFIRWIVKEARPIEIFSFLCLILTREGQHSQLLALGDSNPLSKAVEQVRQWILSQFKLFPFSGFDNAYGLDLWVFATISGDLYRPSGEFNMQLTDIIYVQEDIAFDSRNVEKLVTPSVKMCWGLLQYMLFFFDDNVEASDLLGDYAFTGDRYLYAARKTFQYLMHGKSFEYIADTLELFSVALDRAIPDRVLGTLLQRSWVDHAPIMTSRNGELMSEGASRAYAFLWHEYESHCPDFWSPEVWASYLQHLANAVDKYVKQTRRAFPNLDYAPREAGTYTNLSSAGLCVL